LVWGSGDFTEAKVILVGEAPGEAEDLTGLPFVGRTGMFLRNTIRNMFSTEAFRHIFITNLVQCRPPYNRDPKEFEITKCYPWLDYKIKRSNAGVIICVGKISARRLIGERFQWGSWYEIGGRQYTSVYHPSHVMRNITGTKLNGAVITASFETWLKIAIRAGGIKNECTGTMQ
jgi:DNA polymerase